MALFTFCSYHISPALKEAAVVNRMWNTIKEQLKGDFNCKKPAVYKHIKNNFPIGNVQISKKPSNVCECSAEMENPCGESSNCLNRLTLVECSPQVHVVFVHNHGFVVNLFFPIQMCNAGEKCQNQRFMKREYPDQGFFRTDDGRGWGLRANADIKKVRVNNSQGCHVSFVIQGLKGP